MQDKTTQTNIGSMGKSLMLVSGIAALVVGLIGSSFGAAWSPQVYEFMFGFKIIETIDKFMPYFPMVPFYPLFIMVLGTFLVVKSKS